MNKKVLLLLSFGFVLAGCGKGEGPPEPDVCAAPPDIPVDCAGDPKAPAVILNFAALTANPPNVCAEAGTTINYMVTPANIAEGTAHIFPKDEADEWLSGSNTPDAGQFEVQVPEDLEPGPHDYGMRLDSGECLDPRVEIIPSLAPMLEQAAEPAAD